MIVVSADLVQISLGYAYLTGFQILKSTHILKLSLFWFLSANSKSSSELIESAKVIDDVTQILPYGVGFDCVTSHCGDNEPNCQSRPDPIV